MDDRLPPLKAAHAHCLECCNGSASEVAQCSAVHCPLWLLRSGERPTPEEIEQHAAVSLHPYERPATVGALHARGGATLKAIRRRCIDCSGNSLAEVRSCKFEVLPASSVSHGHQPEHRANPRAQGRAAGEASAMKHLSPSETAHRTALFRPRLASAHKELSRRQRGPPVGLSQAAP